MEQVTLEINGKSVQAPQRGHDPASGEGGRHQIPTLCDDDRLEPYGACRMCMVEIVKPGGSPGGLLPFSCGGGPVRSDGYREGEAHPQDDHRTPLATWQQYAQEYGVTKSRFHTGMTDCSLCGMCVRYCAEVKKENVLYFKGRGH